MMSEERPLYISPRKVFRKCACGCNEDLKYSQGSKYYSYGCYLKVLEIQTQNRWLQRLIFKTDVKPINHADGLVASLHDRKSETLILKSHDTCNLFRCLICWRYIFPDDEIENNDDGYVHKVCKGMIFA